MNETMQHGDPVLEGPPETDPDQLRAVRDLAAMGLDISYEGLSGEVLVEDVNRRLWKTGDEEAAQKLFEFAESQYNTAMSAYDSFLESPAKTKEAKQDALTNVFVAMKTARIMYFDGFPGTVSRIATAHGILLDNGLYEGKVKARISHEEIDNYALALEYAENESARTLLYYANHYILEDALRSNAVLVYEGVPGAKEDFAEGFAAYLNNAAHMVAEAPHLAAETYERFNDIGESVLNLAIDFDFNSAEVADFLWAVARTNVRFMPGETKTAVMNALADLLDQDPENYDYLLQRRKLEKHVNGLTNCVNGNYLEYTLEFRKAFKRLTGKDVFTLLDSAQKLLFLQSVLIQTPDEPTT
jgi:hypothetical protein